MTISTKLSRRVAIYGRFSSHMQNEKSATDQTRRCEEQARLNGWTILHRFKDEAMSGAENKRPGYQELLAAIERGEIDVVMAESLSRLTRNQTEASRIFETCQYHDTEIVTLAEGKMTRMHIGMLGTMNSVGLENLAEATYRGLESRVLAGRSGGGRAYGYRVPQHPNGQPMTGELEIVEEEAMVIRRIFADYAKGLSPLAIVTALNAEGIPAPHGKDRGLSKGDGRWRVNTIHGNRQRGTGILNNELYSGKRVWNRLRYVRKPGEKARVSRINPESEWRVHEVPALRIVPEDLWQAVRARQQRLDAVREAKDKGDTRHLSGSHATRRPTYLLSGLIRCGCCGGSMNIGGSQPKRYFCANAREKGPAACTGSPGIRKDVLEQTVLDGLRHHLMQPEAVKQFISGYQAQLVELDDERRQRAQRLDKKLSETNKQITNLVNFVAGGGLDADATETVKQNITQLTSERKRLEAELADLGTAVPVPTEDIAALYRTQIDQLTSALNDSETRPEAIEAIRQLIDRVTVHWDAQARHHVFDIEGKLAELLGLADNKNAAAYGAAASSLKLVAGA